MIVTIGVEVDMIAVIKRYIVGFASLIRDEFRLVFSDGGVMLILVFAMLIYTIIYSLAYGNEVVREVAIAVVDEDKSVESRRVINGLRSGPRTRLYYEVQDVAEAQRLFYLREVYGIVIIPKGFEQDVLGGNEANVGVILDGSHLLLYRQVLEQVTEDVLTEGAAVETMRLIASGANGEVVGEVVQPVIYDGHTLHNSSAGYGSFVMPSVVVVIIQQTLLIGLGMLGVRRRELKVSTANILVSMVAKMLCYMIIYAINLTIILGVVWPIFGFPYEGPTSAVVLLFALYVFASASLGMLLSHLFRQREAPLMLLLWSSVPILLLAGVSYPREAFPEWLYILGRLFPSSSAVNAYVNIGTAGAGLGDVIADIVLLAVLALLYFIAAVAVERRRAQIK